MFTPYYRTNNLVIDNKVINLLGSKKITYYNILNKYIKKYVFKDECILNLFYALFAIKLLDVW